MTEHIIAHMMKGRTLEERQKLGSSRLLLVGQAVSRRGGQNPDPERACMGGVFQAWCTYLGITYPYQYQMLFDRVNLVPFYPGGLWEDSDHHNNEIQGDTFPAQEAEELAQQLLPMFDGYKRVFLLGRRTAKAFGVKDNDWFRGIKLGGSMVHLVPHPSEANRWHNHLGNQKMLGEFWRQIMTRVYPGVPLRAPIPF